MNGIIVDLFAGGGGASEGIRLALGRCPDVAINHDADAIRMHEDNHPQTRHYHEDVYAVDKRGTTTRTSTPWTPSKRPPGATSNSSGLPRRASARELSSLRAKACVPLRALKRPVRELVENPYWPKAADMEGKLWATPHTFPESQIPTCQGAEFSEDFFYLVGRWVGDGMVTKGDVEICTGRADFPELLRIAETNRLKRANGEPVPIRVADRDSTKAIVWGNAPLARWLQENFGCYSEAKSLPTWCLSMQANWRRALLEGYVDADGHTVDNRVETVTVSKALAIGVRLLATSLGYAAALYMAKGRNGVIEGRPYVGRDAYRVHWRINLKHETVRRDDTHQFSPVREVVPTGEVEPVFCISVDEDESFVADGIVVHNCTHFSQAKGGVPLNEQSRSLAWVIVDGREAPEANPPRAPRGWARDVRPAVIVLENVMEFLNWGPLGPDGRPIKERKGETFREFVGALVDLGYRVEWRVLNAADYGAPTSRRRLFLIARCDGRLITWPAPTHGPGRLPYRTAAECIDFRIPVPSIFHRRRPLAEKTLARIAKGIQRFVFDTDTPYVVRPDGKLFSPSLVQTGYGERKGQAPRILDLHAPLGAVVAGGQKHALVAAFLTKFYGTSTGSDLREPTPTTTAGGTHAGLVAAFLAKHYGGVVGQDLDHALGTVTAKDHHSLVTVTIEGAPYYIADIGMRMLQPRELATAQGFRADYILRGTKTSQVARIGNSVCPAVAAAIVSALLPREQGVAA